MTRELLRLCGRPRTVFWLAATMWLLLCLPPAVAQSNSLLGRRWGAARSAPPTSQPAAQTPEAARPAADAPRDGGLNPPTKPKRNAVLLQMSPFAVESPEPEKFRVNDQVTVIIRETKTTTTDSKLQSKKDWKLDAALKKWLKLTDEHGVQPAEFTFGNPAIALDWKNDYKGDGKYDRKDEFTTRIQATVVDVKPNGTLVLEARKTVLVDDEGYTVTLTGECRSRDITPQNTVLSTQIANLTIEVQDSGAVRDATRRGWIMRGLDFLRPF